jgi:hypothetical protein
VLAAVDSLAEDPRPDSAFPLGATGMLRLRAGKCRVVYQIDEATREQARRTQVITDAESEVASVEWDLATLQQSILGRVHRSLQRISDAFNDSTCHGPRCTALAWSSTGSRPPTPPGCGDR